MPIFLKAIFIHLAGNRSRDRRKAGHCEGCESFSRRGTVKDVRVFQNPRQADSFEVLLVPPLTIGKSKLLVTERLSCLLSSS